MDEHEVERRMRAGLEAWAAEADVAVPVVARAREEVARRRRRRWGVAAAAAAVVLVVGGVAVVTRGGEEAEPPPADRTTGEPPGWVRAWRTEYWRDVAVNVPAGWGYGGAPSDGTVACFPEEIIGFDGERLPRPGDRGWVGRPIGLTDVCVSVLSGWQPTAPYVWLGADLEPGTHEFDNGYVQETVEVGGTTVTVGTDDADLREAILRTLRAGDRCAPSLPDLPRGETELGRHGEVAWGEQVVAEACAYRREASGEYWLSYAVPLSRSQADATFAAADDAPGVEGTCAADPSEFVVVRAIHRDLYGGRQPPLERSAVYRTDCGGTIDLGVRDVRRLTAAAVEPWSANGIRAVVHASGARWMDRYFIGPQG